MMPFYAKQENFIRKTGDVEIPQIEILSLKYEQIEQDAKTNRKPEIKDVSDDES